MPSTPHLGGRCAVRRLPTATVVRAALVPAGLIGASLLLTVLSGCQSAPAPRTLSASAAPVQPSPLVFSARAEQRAERRRAYAQASLHRAHGNLQGARTWLRHALEVDPDSALLRRELAQLMLIEGDVEPAYALLTEARTLDPTSSAGLAAYSEACRRSGRMDQAVDVLLELLERRPDIDGTYYQAHALLLLAGAYGRGLTVFEEVVERRPGWAFGFEALGDFRLRAGLPEAAKECYGRSIAVGGFTEGLGRKLKLAHMHSLSKAIDALHESTARPADPGLVVPATTGTPEGAR